MDNSRPFVAISTRQSKNDQSKRGTFRTLYGVDSVLPPVKAAVAFIATIRGRYADDYVSDQQITSRLEELLKLSAPAFGLPLERSPCHSLRSGGAPSLFVSGVSLEDIRRFGRWRPITPHEYLWFDDQQYRNLSDLMVNSAGLTDQLRLAAGKAENFALCLDLYLWSLIRPVVLEVTTSHWICDGAHRVVVLNQGVRRNRGT